MISIFFCRCDWIRVLLYSCSSTVLTASYGSLVQQRPPNQLLHYSCASTLDLSALKYDCTATYIQKTFKLPQGTQHYIQTEFKLHHVIQNYIQTIHPNYTVTIADKSINHLITFTSRRKHLFWPMILMATDVPMVLLAAGRAVPQLCFNNRFVCI